jgi:hypothetical protein
MTYSNPHLPMRWQNLAPRLLLEDVAEIVERLRQIYPELVLFPRGLHIHGNREPRYDTVPVRFYSSPREYHDDPWLDDGLSPCGLALRVPWPEDLAAGDPERLIGGRHRRAYDDDAITYRRFGRVVYLDSGINLEIVSADRSAIAALLKISRAEVPEIRWFRHYMSQSSIEFLYNSADQDLTDFVKNVRQCMRGLTTTMNATYDVMTREPLNCFKTRPESIRWLRRCAVEDDLYLGPGSLIEGKIAFLGPPPRLLRQYREEAGLSYGRTTDPKDVKTLDASALRQRQLAGLSRRLPQSIDPDNWSAR